MTRVFISYASSDSKFTRDLVQKLKDRRIKVWIDEKNMIAGEDWKQKIQIGPYASFSKPGKPIP